ncbi:uncharacterized protein B0T23DRAFT_110066 [Neurospora hispaniola]|uniref:Uncharacterized protein n=1 Tax=Neurospora hispaniola TaxID=588809 RepID=A0AAJ0MSF6_9PEZI|nr:hypothetical protein B0T23DRAFT_110066 [Neurospora hispaniola]
MYFSSFRNAPYTASWLGEKLNLRKEGTQEGESFRFQSSTPAYLEVPTQSGISEVRVALTDTGRGSAGISFVIQKGLSGKTANAEKFARHFLQYLKAFPSFHTHTNPYSTRHKLNLLQDRRVDGVEIFSSWPQTEDAERMGQPGTKFATSFSIRPICVFCRTITSFGGYSQFAPNNEVRLALEDPRSTSKRLEYQPAMRLIPCKFYLAREQTVIQLSHVSQGNIDKSPD